MTNWSGYYVGAHGGYAWDPADANFDPATYGTTVVPTLVVTSSSGPLHLAVQPHGWFGGIQFGRNWQNGTMVWGWEVDFSFGDIKDEDVKGFAVIASDGGDDASYTGNVRLKQRVDYFGTLRGRLGWTHDALLIYATGGLAWGHVKTDFEVFNVVAESGAGPAVQAALQAGAAASASRFQFGYAAGGGFEFMFAPLWTVKAEYMFIDLFGGTTLTIPGGTANTDFYMHTVRIGLNRRLAP